MATVPTKVESGLDWCDTLCQQLDVLRANALEFRDLDEITPPDWLFEKAKSEIRDIRQLADFPALLDADAWLGPDGQIGLTWVKNDRTFDLIFAAEVTTAKLTVKLKPILVGKNDIPIELSRFAA